MGAWSDGCHITPTYANDFLASWSNCTVRITWRINSEEAPDDFVLLRSRSSFPDENNPVRIILQEQGQFIAHDRNVPPESGQELIYSLYLVQEDNTRILIDQTSLSDSRTLKPLHLRGAWPNPFNPRTTISFETSEERLVTVSIHNIRGQRVIELAYGQFLPGVHDLVWNGVDGSGRRVESGTYFVTVQSEGMVRSKKILLIK